MKTPLFRAWRSRLSMFILAVAAFVIPTVPAAAAGPARDKAGTDWPNWRGPNHDGISAETGWTTDWPKDGPKRLWEKSVGVGYSSVAVSDGRLYTMGNRDDNDIVWCLDARTGQEIWKYSYPCAAGNYPGPRATPTVDDGRVYTISREGQVFCFEAESGKVLWGKNVQKELGSTTSRWGFAGSPLVVGELLILNVGTAGVALNKITGQVAWNTGTDKAGYATPVAFDLGGRKLVAIFNSNSIAAVDAANGQIFWRHAWKTAHDVNSATPIVSGDRVFVSSGYGVGCALLRVGKDKDAVIWKNRAMRNHFTSCLLWNGYIYGFDDSGYLKCMDFNTGKVKWAQKGVGGKGSVMLADGKLIMMGERGKLTVAEASPKGYKEMASAKVLSGTCWTVPVLSGGRIYVRNHSGTLICLDVRSENGQPQEISSR